MAKGTPLNPIGAPCNSFYTILWKNDETKKRVFHILRFLHFSDNRNEPDKVDRL